MANPWNWRHGPHGLSLPRDLAVIAHVIDIGIGTRERSGAWHSLRSKDEHAAGRHGGGHRAAQPAGTAPAGVARACSARARAPVAVDWVGRPGVPGTTALSAALPLPDRKRVPLPRRGCRSKGTFARYARDAAGACWLQRVPLRYTAEASTIVRHSTSSLVRSRGVRMALAAMRVQDPREAERTSGPHARVARRCHRCASSSGVPERLPPRMAVLHQTTSTPAAPVARTEELVAC
jgi:hypothetical protein